MIHEMINVPEALKSIFPFSQLREDDLARIAPSFEQVAFPPGATIFSDGYPAGVQFFILSGQVKITCRQKNKSITLGLLGEGDHFGDEALVRDRLYETRAVCQSQVTALRIRGAKARAIADSSNDVRGAFNFFYKTRQMACREKCPWRHESETVDLMSRRHPFFLVLRVLSTGILSLLVFSFLLFAAVESKNSATFLLILSFLALIVGAGLCGWSAFEWTNDYFVITHERVLVQKKLVGFYESRRESPINAILSVGIDTSFFGRMLGYGSITVRTYTGDLRFDRLPSPYLIHALLEKRREKAANQTQTAEKDEIRIALSSRKQGAAGQKTVEMKSRPQDFSQEGYDSGALSDFLARFFHLRVQDDESITYRTHWWVLWGKTFLPGLFILAVILAIIGRWLGVLTLLPEGVVYLFGIILILAGCGWWLYQYSDWQNDVYIITGDQLIDVYRKPLGTEDRRSAPVKNIQTVEFERKGLIRLMFNFGTVKIKIGNEELTFDNVYRPSQIQTEIYACYRASLETAKKNEQQKFMEWFKTYDEIKKEGQRPNVDPNDDECG